MKYKRLHPGIEFRSPSPFSTEINVILRTPRPFMVDEIFNDHWILKRSLI